MVATPCAHSAAATRCRHHHKDHHLILGQPKRCELLSVQLMRLGVDINTPGDPPQSRNVGLLAADDSSGAT